jgi:DNA-directed RNA polymerase subunit RPC12/RpoP
MSTVLGILFLIAIVLAVVNGVKKGNARAEARDADDRGIVCPYCGTSGSVTTRDIKVEHVVSGGKTSGAVLTGGISLPAVGLSRRQKGRQHTCGSCGLRWVVA